jgi:redox-sensitive bicupin YhaK (pirin superfamily)
LIASRAGRDGSVIIHQDVDLFAVLLTTGAVLEHAPDAGRRIWIQVARGRVEVNGETLSAGDGAAILDEERISIRGGPGGEILLFDMA